MKGGIFERVDTWIGKTLFVPLIIRVCQLTGATQHRISRVSWFLAMLVAFDLAESFAEKIFFGLLAMIACLSAGLAGRNRPTRSWRWFRLMVAAWMLIQMPMALENSQIRYWMLYDWLILFAEYASTIRTIPPLEAKSERARRAPAHARTSA